MSKPIFMQCPSCREFTILVPADGTPTPPHSCIVTMGLNGVLVPVEVTMTARVMKG
jgi:hypothetical protein